MINKIVIGIMALLLGWTLFTSLGGETFKKEESQTKEIEIENSHVQSDGVQIGDKAPDFALQTMNGEEMKLSDLRGKKVILNFWATWCPPCRAEMPDMQKFYEKNAGEGIEILAVNLTDSEKSLADIEQFMDEFEITFPVLLDEQSEVAMAYYAFSIPTSYFIDSNGAIQQKMVGAMNYDFMVKQIGQME